MSEELNGKYFTQTHTQKDNLGSLKKMNQSFDII